MSVCPYGTIRLVLEGISVEYFLDNLSRKFKFIEIEKNNGYVTQWPIYVFDHISLNPSENVKRFGKICRENQNTFYI